MAQYMAESEPHTIQLLQTIGSPFSKHVVPPEESEELYQLAFKNRVGLLYLDALEKAGRLSRLRREWERLRFRAAETLVTTARLGKALGEAGVPYVVVKTLRPYPATPNDVDVLFLGPGKAYSEAAAALVRAGYVAEDAEPGPLQHLFFDQRGGEHPSWDKRGGIYYVDMYKEMATDYFIYGNKGKIRDQCTDHPRRIKRGPGAASRGRFGGRSLPRSFS